MNTAKQPLIWQPSRQVVRAETRKLIWKHLKGTDFEGEPVAIRDHAGSPLIRRRSRAAIKDMLRAQCRKRYAELREDIKAEIRKRQK